ncbi:MAG: hypothetical protein K0R29_2482 [Pseudobdellovibrio sp.]|nr:hypothetical protein [Pseudobdellovibrio sp.]
MTAKLTVISKYFFILLIAGCASSQPGNQQSGTPADPAVIAVNPAKAASDAALAAYEKFIDLLSAGNVTEAGEFFDQTMIGRQEMTDALNNSKISQKGISFEEQNLKIQALGEANVVIGSIWEKRYFNSGGIQITKRGDTKFFMQKSGKDWKLVGMAGDNVLLP